MAEDLQLGSAIGLQGTPKDYSGQFANLAYRQDVNKQKAAAAERKASERSYKMFDLKPGAMLKGREENTKNRLGSFYENMSQVAANREDPKTNPSIQQSHAENLMYLDSVTKEKQNFDSDLSVYRANPGKYRLNEEVFKTYAGGSSYGDETPYYQPGSLLLPNGDPQARIAELGQWVKPKTTTQDVIGPDGNIQQTDITAIDPADNQFWAEKFYNASVDGTDIDGQVGLQNIRRNLSEKSPNNFMYDPKFSLLNPQEQEELIKTKFIQEAVRGFEAVQGQTEKHNISRAPVTNINVNNGSTSGATNQAVGLEEFTIPAYTTNAKGETVPDQARNFTIQAQNPGYVISMKKGELILPAGPGIVDLQTLKPALNGRGSLDITGGYSATVPVYKKGTATAEGADKRRSDISGLPVPTDLLQQAKEDGLIEYKLKFIGNGVGPNGGTHQVMFDIGQPITDAAILKESVKDQPKVSQGISDAKKFTQDKNSGYKFTREWNGNKYGRNKENENWKLIK